VASANPILWQISRAAELPFAYLKAKAIYSSANRSFGIWALLSREDLPRARFCGPLGL